MYSTNHHQRQVLPRPWRRMSGGGGGGGGRSSDHRESALENDEKRANQKERTMQSLVAACRDKASGEHTIMVDRQRRQQRRGRSVDSSLSVLDARPLFKTDSPPSTPPVSIKRTTTTSSSPKLASSPLDSPTPELKRISKSRTVSSTLSSPSSTTVSVTTAAVEEELEEEEGSPSDQKSSYELMQSMEGLLWNANCILTLALRPQQQPQEQQPPQEPASPAPLPMTLQTIQGAAAIDFRNTTMAKDTNNNMTIDHYFGTCSGICFLSTAQVGLLVAGGSVGTGVFLRHNLARNTWSSPVACGVSTLSVGALWGSSIKDIIIFLMNHETVKEFFERGVQVGMDLNVTLGTDRRGGERHSATMKGKVATTVVFGYSEGIFVGVGLEGGMIAPRHHINQAFYGKGNKDPANIVNGKIPFPFHNSVAVNVMKELTDKLSKVAKEGHAEYEVPMAPSTPGSGKKTLTNVIESVHASIGATVCCGLSFLPSKKLKSPDADDMFYLEDQTGLTSHLQQSTAVESDPISLAPHSQLAERDPPPSIDSVDSGLEMSPSPTPATACRFDERDSDIEKNALSPSLARSSSQMQRRHSDNGATHNRSISFQDEVERRLSSSHQNCDVITRHHGQNTHGRPPHHRRTSSSTTTSSSGSSKSHHQLRSYESSSRKGTESQPSESKRGHRRTRSAIEPISAIHSKRGYSSLPYHRRHSEINRRISQPPQPEFYPGINDLDQMVMQNYRSTSSPMRTVGVSHRRSISLN